LTLVYACIAPHGSEIVPRLAGKKAGAFTPTRDGMKQLAAGLRTAAPGTVVVASPHNLRLKEHIGIVTSENSSGVVAEGGGKISVKAKCDKDFAEKLLGAAEARGLPVVGANYGTNQGPLSDLPMDFGTLIPLWFFLGSRPKPKVVIVTPSRETPPSMNVEFGRVLGALAHSQETKIAFVASADQAHTHMKSGPYGFSETAEVYDRAVLDAVERNRLGELTNIPQDTIEAAKPDSFWQMIMLHGVIDGRGMKPHLYSYQVPTYYGMMCVGYSRGR